MANKKVQVFDSFALAEGGGIDGTVGGRGNFSYWGIHPRCAGIGGNSCNSPSELDVNKNSRSFHHIEVPNGTANGIPAHDTALILVHRTKTSLSPAGRLPRRCRA